MIVFDLKCGEDHVFEAWFKSSAAFDEQRAAGLIACPTCGSANIGKSVMAPNVGAKSNAVPAASDPRAAARAALAAIAAAQAETIKNSHWVGQSFATSARAMHEGREPERPIHGQASREEAEALIEDGVPVQPLLVPVVPPESRN